MDSITMCLNNVTVTNHDLEANREGKGIEPTYSFCPSIQRPKEAPPPPSILNAKCTILSSQQGAFYAYLGPYVETMEQYQHIQQSHCQGKGGCKFKRFR